MNPADIISTSRVAPPAMDAAIGFLAGLGSAAAAHPVMTCVGVAGIVAIMGAAWHMTRLGNESARAASKALAATQAATAAIFQPGALPDFPDTAPAPLAAADLAERKHQTQREAQDRRAVARMEAALSASAPSARREAALGRRVDDWTQPTFGPGA